ncbi:MAG: dienelactone hydrolase family protein [Proteobacteria bacterium]|nr:dienelactone hydrolase family protein [Pseudomonadota bacterium]
MVSYYAGWNLRFPQSDDPPILFLHGDEDDTTQWQAVVAFCEESRKAGRVCEYNIYKDTGHSFTHRYRPVPSAAMPAGAGSFPQEILHDP